MIVNKFVDHIFNWAKAYIFLLVKSLHLFLPNTNKKFKLLLNICLHTVKFN